MRKISHFSRNLMVIGIFLGLLFPALAITVDLYLKGLPWQLSTIKSVFIQNPIQWIVASAPLVLVSIFYFLGRIINARENQLNAILNQEKAQLDSIHDVLSNFYQRDYQNRRKGQEQNQLLGMLAEFKTRYHDDRDRESQQTWSAQGLAKLVDILYSSDDIEILSKEVIRFLVKYINLAHGALFVSTEIDNEQFLELKAVYASDDESPFIQRGTVPVGDGLIGQCFVEKNKIILSEVPRDYLKISSGLGNAVPASLLIFPVKNNVHIEGVIEMAGFRQPENYKLEFLEKATENIASTLHNIKVGNLTRDLLEESQQQTEEMRAQEEEMRQTMEELSAIQEEMLRKEKEYVQRIEQLELASADYQRREWEYKHQLEQLQIQLQAK